MIRAACAVVLVLAATLPAAAVDCPLDKAVYTPLDADDDWSAADGVINSWEITHPLKPDTSADRPWVVRLAEKRQGLAAEFAIADPPGFSAAHVYMLVPPGGTGKGLDPGKAPASLLYYFGDDLKRVDPRGEAPPKAPPLMQLPGLSKAFWAWKRDGRRFIPPDGLWKLTACRS